ncbi:hypothetical protein M427DRAFT_105373, partial [Gonapodya prolifera JEL478]
YTLQHLRIIRLRSSEGLAPIFFLFGGIASTSTLWNVLLLQSPVVKCCVTERWSCLQNTLALIQVLVQWASFQTVFILFMIYFPVDLRYVHHPHVSHQQNSQESVKRRWTLPSYSMALFVAFTQMLYVFIAIVVTFVLLAVHGPGAEAPAAVAALAGGISLILSCLQMLPQIWETWKTKYVAALSISSLCIQTPGGLAVAILIASTPGTNPSSWASYVVSASFQSILLGLALWYTYQGHGGVPEHHFEEEVDENGGASSESTGTGLGGRERRLPVGDSAIDVNETTPLIGS